MKVRDFQLKYGLSDETALIGAIRTIIDIEHTIPASYDSIITTLELEEEDLLSSTMNELEYKKMEIIEAIGTKEIREALEKNHNKYMELYRAWIKLQGGIDR